MALCQYGPCDICKENGWYDGDVTSENYLVPYDEEKGFICPSCYDDGHRFSVSESEKAKKMTGGIAAGQLSLYIERIERIEEEKSNLMADIKEVYGEAKALGYDVKILRQIVRLRKMEEHERMEQEELLETYKKNLGMS